MIDPTWDRNEFVTLSSTDHVAYPKPLENFQNRYHSKRKLSQLSWPVYPILFYIGSKRETSRYFTQTPRY